MRLYQTPKNYVAQVVLERDIPLLTDAMRSWLVSLHADFFVEASETDGEARRAHLDALFDATIDAYLRALDEGYPEAEAREITHVMAAWDFQNQGWGELLEFPPDERREYYEKYSEFFDAHDANPENPLGEFAPPTGLPYAPTTPERLDGEFPFAEPGLVDDIYVHAPDDEVHLGCGR
ncbi:DUF6149 family protein [Salarchaeum japonicum]|uniref:DUF6149 family protein n=1 Tax=Salarchaeum japonicum TaxID=555573 RepID=A0AAV3SXK2_9EURY|nr:DUF6149 family protein [Salarchaeum japonicum]